MGAFLGLIGGLRGLAVIGLIVLVAGWAFVQRNNVEKAEAARDQAIAQRDQVARERDKAIEAARVNEQTISRLEQEKADINQALNTIQQARVENRTNTVTREIIIEKQATTPESQSVAAPVLGEIVEAVQDDRQRRRGGGSSALRSNRPASQNNQRIME